MPVRRAVPEADSALRNGDVTQLQLLDAAEPMPARYRGRCLRIAQQADARADNPFEFHGQRRLLKRDCERYNAFVLEGWLVIRFAWEHVMFDPAYVSSVLRSVVRLLTEQPPRRALGDHQSRLSA